MAKKEKNKNGEEKEKNQSKNSASKKASLAKKILKITGFTFAGILAAVILLVLFHDPVIKFGVTSIGSWITGVEITLEDIDTSLTKGTATVKGLRIANPQGFECPYMLELGEFHADIDLGSLTTKEIVIEDIRVKDLYFTAEFDDNSSFNVTELTGNLKKRFPPDEDDVEKKDDDDITPNETDPDEKSDDPALLFQNIDVNLKLTLVHDFSNATLSMPVSYAKQNLRIGADDDDVPIVERLDAMAKYFESFCQACFNAGAFVVSAGEEAGEILKSGFSAGVDGGKKVFEGGKKVLDGGKKVIDSGIDGGKSLLDSATKLFK